VLEKIEFHFRSASSVLASAKLIFYKSGLRYLQAHLEHEPAYLLLIFLIITMGLEASTICHVLSKRRGGKELWADFRKRRIKNCFSLT
jgi:hypothetical protein